jgi:GNAT superfamily N-acetyltransferase
VIARAALDAALEATWPPASVRDAGPFRLREGRGGGQRVSAATACGPWAPPDVDAAEAAMRALSQSPIFRLAEADATLDAELARRGYAISDPTVFYAAPLDLFDPAPPPMTGFAHWPPLRIVCRIWAEGGIGPARQAVMDRVTGPRTALLARTADRPSGAAFVACHDAVTMLHAVEVVPDLRRRGSGGDLVRHAAAWAALQGARHLTLAVTEANMPARALYARLGMTEAGRYHYRVAP